MTKSPDRVSNLTYRTELAPTVLQLRKTDLAAFIQLRSLKGEVLRTKSAPGFGARKLIVIAAISQGVGKNTFAGIDVGVACMKLKCAAMPFE